MVTPCSTPKDSDNNEKQETAGASGNGRSSLIDRSNWVTYVLGATAFITLLAFALILIGTNENRIQIAWTGLWLFAGATLTWLITMGIIVFLIGRDVFRYFRNRFAQRRDISGHDGDQVDSA